jgi:cytochrome c6
MQNLFRMSGIALLAVCTSLAYAQKSGEEVYKANCALCHGATGEADTPAGKTFKATQFTTPDTFKKSDAELIAFTKKGKGQMPAWEGELTDDQLKNVIAYIHTLEKK